MSTTPGVSGPSGNHASAVGPHSSLILARSRTTSAEPDTETQAVESANAALAGLPASISCTLWLSASAKNHRSPS